MKNLLSLQLIADTIFLTDIISIAFLSQRYLLRLFNEKKCLILFVLKISRMDLGRYNPEGSSLRDTQKELVKILQVVADICDENGIRWWLSSGTLLGAARHKGFIPWDDDIDIEMLKEDYKKLKKILLKMESEEYFVQCCETDIEFVDPFIKFRSRKGFLDGRNPRSKNYKYGGIHIDIFCIEKTNYAAARASKVVYWELQHTTKYINIKWLRRLLIRLIQIFCFGLVIPVIRLFGKINPKQEYHYSLGTGWYKNTFHLDEIFPLSKAEFEGCMFPVPHDVDAILTSAYGDWRKLPSEEQIRGSIHNKEYIREIFGE